MCIRDSLTVDRGGTSLQLTLQMHAALALLASRVLSKNTAVASKQLKRCLLYTSPPGSVRIRATYEKSSATFESDAYDPASSKITEQYQNLEGRSLEYVMEPDGQLAHFMGLDDLLANRSVAENIPSWMNGLSSAARIPKDGIEVGQKSVSYTHLDVYKRQEWEDDGHADDPL